MTLTSTARYASAASGPKDVVIVIDMSGSMANGKRVQMAIAATQKVLDTLSWVDHVSVVSFDATATAYSATLQRATPDVLARMAEWVGRRRPGATGTRVVGSFCGGIPWAPSRCSIYEREWGEA